MSRKIILFIATSIDGYIADANGGVKWLDENVHGSERDDSYTKMYSQIDTVVLGRKTYDQVVNELFPEKYIYEDKMTYVVTSQKRKNLSEVNFVDESPVKLIKSLKNKSGKDIWIIGGQQLIDPLVKNNLIDQYILTTVPIFLGNGIRLFDHLGRTVPVRLIETYAKNELVYSIYGRGE